MPLVVPFLDDRRALYILKILLKKLLKWRVENFYEKVFTI